MMRKVDVVRPPINYTICRKNDSFYQVAWFVDKSDALEFFESMKASEAYEIAEVRR